jgi:low affinity Fe/Cu permease
MPSDVSTRVGAFDRFAGLSAKLASRAPFFIFCIGLVIAWLIEGAVRMATGGGLAAFQDSSYQLQINTTTTIVTFLLVALLQNSQTRSDQATQHKLNAIADGLADFTARTASAALQRLARAARAVEPDHSYHRSHQHDLHREGPGLGL